MDCNTKDDVQQVVARYWAAGLQCIPIRTDGSKAPSINAWKPYQDPGERVDLQLFAGRGVAILGGQASGGAEFIDFDDPALYSPWCSLVEDRAPGLVQRVVVIQTPRQNAAGEVGRHVAYRCPEPSGNVDLAFDENRKATIQTRGEGGYVLTVGSPPSCHPSGRCYELLAGELTDLPMLTMAERSTLFNCARALTELVETEAPVGNNGNSSPVSESVGDEFAASTSWHDLLAPHGWARIGDSDLWRRPGKEPPGWSASSSCTSKAGRELLKVFSSNAAPFVADKAYNKFTAFTLLNHHGDFKAAASDLHERGFGMKGTCTVDFSTFETDEGARESVKDPFAAFPGIISGSTLIRIYPDRRPVIVDGLIREGDVANIVAAPKVGKSWLAMGLAASVASGGKWLNTFDTKQGRVLYIDNELDPTDAAFRLRAVAENMGLPKATLDEWFHIASFRGYPIELDRVCSWLRHCLRDKDRGYYKLIIIDTLSKMLAGDKSENDNLYIRSIYTKLESLTSDLGLAVGIVHHASRGDQGEKAVTDCGAGAGSQSRACDCHMVIRPHSEEGMCVLDSTVRSFAGSPSLSIRWDYPLWKGEPEKTAELGTRESKKRHERTAQAQQEITDILDSEFGDRFSINKLHERMEGYGVIVIRKACEALVEAGRIRRATEVFRGADVFLYYTGN